MLILKNLFAIQTTQLVTLRVLCFSSATSIHTHNRTVCRADMVDILRAVQEVGHPEEEEDRPENQPSNEANDAGD